MKFWALYLLVIGSLVGNPTLERIVFLQEHAEIPNLVGEKPIVGMELLPGEHTKFLSELIKTHMGKEITADRISALEQATAKHFAENHRPFVCVAAKEQDISDGTILLQILEGCVGGVSVRGNCYWSDETIERMSRLCIGGPVDIDLIYNDLNWMNRNLYRSVDVVFAPGTAHGMTDVEFVVEDRLPLRVYVGIDNTGNDFTGNDRLFAGLNWGNLFDLEQTFSYQYTTDNNFKRFQAHTGYYSIPLPWRNILTFYGGYSYIDTRFDLPGVNLNRFRNNGYAGQLSMRYDIPLPTYKNFMHEFTWGTDWKKTNNAIFFNVVSINPQAVNLFQLMARYTLGYEIKHLRLASELEIFGNPGRWLPDQKDSDYASIRPFAKNAYIYSRAMGKALWRFVDPFLLSLQFRGQVSSANLLPSEQLGVGGYSSVRGYKERELNGDSGVLVNLELQSYPKSIATRFSKCQRYDQFQLLAFFDYGLAIVHKSTSPGAKKTDYAMSIGPGARYFWNPYIMLQADWGFQLHHIPGSGPNQRFHFYTTIAY